MLPNGISTWVVIWFCLAIYAKTNVWNVPQWKLTWVVLYPHKNAKILHKYFTKKFLECFRRLVWNILESFRIFYVGESTGINKKFCKSRMRAVQVRHRWALLLISNSTFFRRFSLWLGILWHPKKLHHYLYFWKPGTF